MHLTKSGSKHKTFYAILKVKVTLTHFYFSTGCDNRIGATQLQIVIYLVVGGILDIVVSHTVCPQKARHLPIHIS